MKIFVTVFLCFVYLNNNAQDNEKLLDPVTVTGSIQPRPISQTGRNILNIKGSEFANLPVHSIDELLRYLPGIEVQQRGPMGAQSDIVIRGGTFQQVLVLIDGVRINDPNTGHFNSYIPISPVEIDHIEILKGASSALYGSEAVGGVVQIVTKTFSAKQHQQHLDFQAAASTGERNLLNLNAGVFYQKNQSAISGGLISLNTSGQPQRGTYGFLHNTTGSISASHFFNKRLQLSVRTAYDNRDFSAQNFYTNFLSDTASEKVRSIWSQAKLIYTIGKHQFSLDAGYKDVKDDYAFNKASIANANSSRMFQTQASDTWTIDSKTALISGLQFIEKSIRSNDRGDHSVPQAAAFAILHYTVTPKFFIDPALRLDWNERSGAELIPQLNLSYRIKKLQLRGSAGKTIRDADFTERYNNYNKAVVSSGRIGNPDLQAEHSFSYELGADYYLNSSFKISGTLFQRLHRQLIDYVTTPYAEMPRKDNLVVGGTYALAKNIARINTSGAELDIQYQKKLSKEQLLNFGLGLTWLDTKSSETAPSFYIASHAKFNSNLFLEYRDKLLLMSITSIYKTRQKQTATAINAQIDKTYFLMNAKVGVFAVQQKLNLFIQGDNVFDKNYSDLLGAILPGRWLSFGLSMNLNH